MTENDSQDKVINLNSVLIKTGSSIKKVVVSQESVNKKFEDLKRRKYISK